MSVTTSVPAGTGVTTPARYRVVDKNGNVRNVVFGPVPTFPKFGYNDNFVGAAPGIDELKEMFHNAVSGGAGVIRIPVPWCVIEKDATGGPDWDHGFGFRLGKLFDEVKVANANGIEVQTLPVIFNAPDWAKGLPVDPHDDDPCGDNGPHDATHDGEWKDFVTAFLNRFGPSHVAGGVARGDDDFGLIGIEVYNEPNFHKFWSTPDPGRFAEIVADTGDAVSALGLRCDRSLSGCTGDPAVAVVPGGLSPAKSATYPPNFTFSFLSALQALGELGSIDVMNMHLYADSVPRQDTATATILNQYWGLIGTTQFAGVAFSAPWLKELPHWVTEIGVASNGHYNNNQHKPRSDSGQRRRLCDSYLELLTRSPSPALGLYDAKVDMLLVHQLYNEHSDPLDGLQWGTWGNQPAGVGSNPVTDAKPVYKILRTLAAGAPGSTWNDRGTWIQCS